MTLWQSGFVHLEEVKTLYASLSDTVDEGVCDFMKNDRPDL